MKLKDIKTLEEFQNFILYGDLHKVPVNLLGEEWCRKTLNTMDMDKLARQSDAEQMLRLKMAVAVEVFINNFKPSSSKG